MTSYRNEDEGLSRLHLSAALTWPALYFGNITCQVWEHNSCVFFLLTLGTQQICSHFNLWSCLHWLALQQRFMRVNMTWSVLFTLRVYFFNNLCEKRQVGARQNTYFLALSLQCIHLTSPVQTVTSVTRESRYYASVNGNAALLVWTMD